MPWEGRRRTGANNSMRLNETLFETLQTPQTVSSQHAKQVCVRSISRGAIYTGTFTCLEIQMIDLSKCMQHATFLLKHCLKERKTNKQTKYNKHILLKLTKCKHKCEQADTLYLNKLLQE